MYRYRINNSYSVEVNHQYYAEAKQICKAFRTKYCKTGHMSIQPHTKAILAPLSIGTALVSKTYGTGVSTSDGMNGILSVDFGGKAVRFLYPDALRQGYLKTL